MTETATGKVEITQFHRYTTPGGIDYGSVPWRLWEKGNRLFWNPADLDFSQDTEDWTRMTDEQRLMVGLSASGFMLGEEAVTLDIIPLLRTMSDLNRLEDTMYLTQFAMEEARHTHFFRRWFDAVGFDTSQFAELIQRFSGGQQQGNGRPRGVFDGQLTQVMRRLDNDKSPEAILDATIVYNQLVEGVAAIAGYYRWNKMFRSIGGLPGLEEGLKLVQRDERRHIAYGTYLGRKIIAEHPETWDFFERRWEELTQQGALYGNRQGQQGGYAALQDEDTVKFRESLVKRRYEVLAVARGMRPEDVESSPVEAFEPEL